MDRFLSEVERRAFVMAKMATKSAEEALDIVQDSMMGFVRRYSHKPESEWAPLFFTVLNSRIVDWHRRQAVRRRWQVFSRRDDDSLDPVASAADPRSVTPERALHSEDSGSAIQREVARLPDRQRQAFLLRTWQGFSVADAAKAMGCSEGSVKTHLSRALSTLRDALEEFHHA